MSSLRRDDVDKFFDYSIHIPSRTLYMGPETDAEMAERFVKGMRLLETISKDIGITVIMNNLGGDEYDGLAAYDAIATSRCHITVVVYGSAMSMGSWILQAADERVMSPNATLMIHHGSFSMDVTLAELRARNREVERLTTLMEETYLEKMRAVDPKASLAKLRAMLAAESYITAQDAVRLGFADRVLEKTSA